MKHVYHEGEEPVPGAGYRLVGFLGRGGFGEVWKATTPGGAEAAMKIIQLGGAEGRKEFRALQLVKRIRHPNLMPLVAFWLKSDDGAVLDDVPLNEPEVPSPEVPGDTYRGTMVAATIFPPPRPAELIIAMGLGDKSLMDRLQECRASGQQGVPVEELLGYMEDAAEAIDYLNSPVHDQGSGPIAVQHCDIKPHNLMIVGGAVQVCDFGLARMMGVDRVTTGAASLAYAAPELLDSNKVSSSTDQYSLAITYFELRTAKLPYRDDTIAAVLDAKQDGTLDFSACTPAEQEVLGRATSRDPGQRFPSTTEMVKALRRATAIGPEGGGGSPAAQRDRGWGAVLKGLILVSLVGAASFAAWKYYRPEPLVPEPAQPSSVGPIASVASAVTAKTSPPTATTMPPQPGDAITPAVSAKKSPPTSAEALLQRGTEQLEKGELDRAIADFGEATLLAPGDVRPLSRRGTAWLRKKEYQKAIDDFSAALQVDPGATDCVNRGRCYRAMGRLPEAIADFDAAIRSNPALTGAYYLRGDCHLTLERYREAISDLTQAIELASQTPDPTFALADAYTLRGSACLLTQRAEEAIKDLTAAIRLDPKDPASVHQSRADAYELANHPALAKCDSQIADLLKRIEDKPNDAAACRELAYLLATHPEADIRNGKRAVDLATRACKLTSEKDAADLDALAAAYAEVGQFDDAVRSAKKAVELAPNEETAKLYRARLAACEKKTPLRQKADSR
jgi:tetratricopeptide (TPR) repeat protein